VSLINDMAINEWMWVSFFISINEIGVTCKDQRKREERNKCCTLSNTSNNEVSKEASPCAALCLQFQKTRAINVILVSFPNNHQNFLLGKERIN
jgi:hypothetical protein